MKILHKLTMKQQTDIFNRENNHDGVNRIEFNLKPKLTRTFYMKELFSAIGDKVAQNKNKMNTIVILVIISVWEK